MSRPLPACVGVVAAGHRETARAGAQILARGGNAVDAACAAAAAAAIAECPLTGPGAGGFLTIHPDGGPPHLVDFFVAAPGLGPQGRPLTPEMLDSFMVPFGDAEQEFFIGPASVAVPGLMQGLVHAVTAYGRMSVGEVLDPAIVLSREGVRITTEVAFLFEILQSMLRHSDHAERLFAPRGEILRHGDNLRLPELAESFEEIAATGGETLRTGAIAAAIVDHLSGDGCVTRDDLARYEVIEREPLCVARGDMEFATNPPPSAGGLLIMAALHAIAPDEIDDETSFYRALVDAGAHANSLRDEEFMEGLQSPGFAEALLAKPTRKPTGTTNVSVIDADGMMASLSSSCGSGAGVVVPGTGILLNNMMGEQDLNPEGFGSVPPGRRMTSMMAPTIASRDGTPMVALGSAGSNRLRSAILQTLVGVVDCGLSVSEAVNRPRVHPEGGGVDVELGVPESACSALEAAGYRLRRWQTQNLFFGGVSAVTTGSLGPRGAGDPRRGGAAVGVTRHGEVVDL